MGIPKFFRWLTRRYPMILTNVKKEEDCPPVDNLYMDLNGIVHNCIHGNDSKKHEKVSRLNDLEDVWADIMRAIDEIVHSIKPRKVILLALDGVAPRAKMNQQRARRFRSAQESEQLKQQLRSQGKQVTDLFDSNQISPGTPFMYELGKQLEWFVKYKINTDPLYQQCEKVLVSDTSVPGEGEHKMMDFIRNLKRQESYDPNTRHCFYGSDADLIMLSLITHEPHFMIIREEHVVKKTKQGGIQRIDISRTANFQLIHISILREYFLLEYRPYAAKMKMRFDLERIIDDFVFFCFFIGNDFLPSLSALDISEGSLDHLINFYKKLLPNMTDYITKNGQIFWDRAEQFIEMLGKHEHQVFINRVKTLDAQYENSKNILTFADGMPSRQTTNAPGLQDAKIVQQRLQARLKSKKERKCAILYSQTKQKKFKKQFLLKKFSEDYEANLKTDPEAQKNYLEIKQKYTKLRQYQIQKEKSEDHKTGDEDDKSINQIIESIKEEYFSDLIPEDVPNSDVSDDNDEDVVEDVSIQQSTGASSQSPNQIEIEARQNQSQIYIDQNHQFMREFVNTYKSDANKAKRDYYLQKLNFDLQSTIGRKDLHKMLFRYLEGLQWVYYYYYKGAQHWRWYYPYHYAPMISDLGENIVKHFLDGKNVIEEFKPDEHCKQDRQPYTPFQQLLCIFPVKSVRAFLPKEYLQLAEGILNEYFPSNFDIDLNGRTLPWEAVVLIPFVDEDIFINAEKQLFENGMHLSEVEKDRNTIKFIYNGYLFDKSLQQGQILESTLKQMGPIQNDRSKSVVQRDYEDVGQFCFPSKLLQGVVSPQPDFPSIMWLNADGLDFAEVYIQKVCFHRALVRVPQYKEDTDGKDFEDWIYKFEEQRIQELYVNFPQQIEAFPLYFEDPYSIYTLQAIGGNRIKVSKSRQIKSPEEFGGLIRVQRANLDQKGIKLLGDINTFVTVSPVKTLEYDEQSDLLYKLYQEESFTIPFNMIMKTRSPNHYLNVAEKCSSRVGRLRTGLPTVCFDPDLFGLIGHVKRKNAKNHTVTLEINQEQELSKIHDPFMAEKLLREIMSDKSFDKRDSDKLNADENILAQRIRNEVFGKQYFGDRDIEKMLKLQSGFINRITGSYLIAYDEAGKEERQVVDIGLNVKNFTKKVHVVEFVRFVAPNQAANTIYDEFQHSKGSHGGRHVRKHWEYSQECIDIIKDYYTQYPEILDAINKESQKSKAMHKLTDLYPGLKKDGEEGSLVKLKKLLTYLESLPISKLPYVEMGFDTLDSQLIQRLQNHQLYVERHYDRVKLDLKKFEEIGIEYVFQESYPFWYRPQYQQFSVNDFRVGNRVMNICSVNRKYVPYGARGTVVGKTEEAIIVLFDQQFIQGNTIYGHCEPYRGAMIFPNYLINLTREFAQIASNDKKLIKKFQEKPQEGLERFGQVKPPIQHSKPNQVPSKSQQIDSKLSNQQWIAKVKPFTPQVQQEIQQSMVYKPKSQPENSKKNLEGVVFDQTQNFDQTENQQNKQSAINAQQETPSSNQITDKIGEYDYNKDSSEITGSPQKVQPQVMFGQLPALKLADPNLKYAPGYQKLIANIDTSVEKKTSSEQDSSGQDTQSQPKNNE